MKPLMLLIVGCLMAAPPQTQAKDYKFYDERGRVTGRMEERPYGGALYDNKGNRIGSVEKTPYGDYIIRNNRGGVERRVRPEPWEEPDNMEPVFPDESDEDFQ